MNIIYNFKKIEKILALDIGRKRIGIALGFVSSGIVFPFFLLERRNRDVDLRNLKEIVEREQIEFLVVGIPYRGENLLGEMGSMIARFVARLERILRIPVFFIDEFESSLKAYEYMFKVNLSKSRKKKEKDKLSAVFILNSFFSKIGSKKY